MTSLLTALLIATTCLPQATTAEASPAQHGWFEGSYNSALRAARQENKPVFIALVPDWSDYSQKMLAETFPDTSVSQLLSQMICLKYEVEDSRSLQVARLYKVSQFPTLVLAQADGSLEDVIIGYFPPQPLVQELQRILSGVGTLADHVARVAADPENLATRYAYAVKLDEVGDAAGFQRELGFIRTADPTGATVTGAQLLQNEVWAKVAAVGPGDEATWDLTPVAEFLETVPLPSARFAGWMRLAGFQRERERRIEAVGAMRRAHESVAPNEFFDWSADVITYVLEADQGDLPEDTGRWTLSLAEELERRALVVQEPDASGAVFFPATLNYDEWLAAQLDILAQAQLKYAGSRGKRLALATSERCLALMPDNDDYKSRVELLKSSPRGKR